MLVVFTTYYPHIKLCINIYKCIWMLPRLGSSHRADICSKVKQEMYSPWRLRLFVANRQIVLLFFQCKIGVRQYAITAL